jgi:hypothetical protein
MTTEQKIRRYIRIQEEVRFLNSKKQYVFIQLFWNGKIIRMRLSDKPNKSKKLTEHMYTREEFNKVLKTEWYKG